MRAPKPYRRLLSPDYQVFLWIFLLPVILGACAPTLPSYTPTTSTSTPKTAGETADAPSQSPMDVSDGIVVPDYIPTVDTAIHSVPLNQIYFDTFRPVNRVIPLDKADPDLIDSLRDAIPPIHDPVYQPGKEADWLSEDDIVLGYTVGEAAWAYPTRILNYHEIVNDVLAGEPALVSYCPLCYSGIVYSRELDNGILTFGNTSALYESDMVMLDYETGSYWWQVAGKAIVGPLTDKTLSVLPSSMMTWAQWLDLYPETLVLSRNTGFGIDYGRNPFLGIGENFNRGNFAFPVSEAALDDQLRPATIVLAFQVGDTVFGVPLGSPARRVFYQTIEAVPISIFLDPAGPSGAVFRSSWGDLSLTFIIQAGDFVDLETGSTWNFSGNAIAGELEGAQLEPIPSRTSFWYAIVAAEPDIQLLSP